jgi:hypothetical protein
MMDLPRYMKKRLKENMKNWSHTSTSFQEKQQRSPQPQKKHKENSRSSEAKSANWMNQSKLSWRSEIKTLI